MAIAHVQTVSATGTLVASIPVTFGAAVTAGNLIVVTASTWSGGDTSASVTDSLGNSYSLVGVRARAAANSYYVWMFYAHNVNGGACTVTVTYSGTGFASAAAMEYSGADTTAGVLADFDVLSDNPSATTGGGSVAVSGNHLYVAALTKGNGDDPTDPVGWTNRFNQIVESNWAPNITVDLVASGSQSPAYTWTNATIWAVVVAAFKEDGGGGGGGTTGHHAYRTLARMMRGG